MIDIYAARGGRKTFDTIELHSMNSMAKSLWRDYWIEKLKTDEDISCCNFITLCGPELLDVQAMMSHGITMKSAVLIECRRAIVNQIVSNINGNTLTRNAAMAGLQTMMRCLPTSYTILNVSFDKIVVNSGAIIQNVLSQKLKSCDTVLGFDFCGSYSEKRHQSITKFLNILKDIKQIQDKKVVAIMNFASPLSSKELNGIEELSDLPVKTKQSRFITTPTVQQSMELYGRFSEKIGQQLVESAQLSNAKVYTPVHYHNGVHSCGYTTNIISYYNSKE